MTNSDGLDLEGAPSVNDELIGDYLCYTNRLRELLRAIGNEEEINIECGPESLERVQTSIKYLTVVLIYEIIQILKDKQKVRFKNEYIDEALSKVLGKSDSFGISIKKISELQEELESLNQQSAINKAMDYINIIEPFRKEGE
ncbi:hypothetical protein KQI74_13810 [Paenibacillus barcinonensis]|uniref:hypothetical protein n=1 Tax=Paenibacillus barcinonensis TaxID=198119 RepID=UPI001C11E33B|nr:hypothetical protein [Paenibacillus barcinonensis]MBU5353367.1 hypothetical protein [Paenibacillus barcinonensis]